MLRTPTYKLYYVLLWVISLKPWELFAEWELYPKMRAEQVSSDTVYSAFSAIGFSNVPKSHALLGKFKCSVVATEKLWVPWAQRCAMENALSQHSFWLCRWRQLISLHGLVSIVLDQPAQTCLQQFLKLLALFRF